MLYFETLYWFFKFDGIRGINVESKFQLEVVGANLVDFATPRLRVSSLIS